MNSLHPKKLYLEVTTRCNLRCAMCVKYMDGSCIGEEDFQSSLFEKIVPSLPFLKTLILNGIGEPLIYPHLIDIITTARKHMPPESTIGFQSNGLLIDDTLAEKLMTTGLDTICLSLDDISDKKDQKKCGHSFTSVQRAVQSLQKAKERVNQSFTIGIETVLSKSTIHSFKNLVQWAGKNSIDYILVTHLIQYDQEAEKENLFNPNTKRAIEIFEKFKIKGEQHGIRIPEAYKLFRAFAGTKSPKNEKQLFNDLLQQAKEENILLNLPELIQKDEENNLILHSVLDEAQKIAEQYDVHLHLPATETLEKRSCSFIEDEAVCVSANGDITPCHFLWHTYNCRMFGENRPVMKKVFGNLASAHLSEIWQQPEYQKFRDEAGEYEYSSCWNCSQGPCVELIANDEDYAHDCHGSSVPCGHCQWALGGIKCL